jgi:hypothetical protein
MRSEPREGLDGRTAALARVAALVALGAPPGSYEHDVGCALAAGASVDDVVGTLKVVARTVGLARVVCAAPGLSLALGYDIDDALETLDDALGHGDRVSRSPPPHASAPSSGRRLRWSST